MKYTTKDVCKIFNITRETLRYYEKKGIIQPEISSENNYRYYDDWDINFIGECKKYQSLDFSLKEIHNIFARGSLNDYINNLEEKQAEFENKLRFYTLLTEKNKHYIQKLKSIPDYLEKYSITESPSYYHLIARKNFEYDLSTSTLENTYIALKNYAFYDHTVFINKEDYQDSNDNFYWCMSIENYLVDKLNIPLDNMFFMPSQTCIHTIIDAGERWNFGCHLFKGMVEYAEKNGYEMNGPIYGLLLTRVYHNDKYCRYLDVYLPVKKK